MENTNTRPSTTSGRSGSESGRPYLMVIGGARVGELHKLTRERTVLGRSPEAQIRLQRDTGVSREHAELVVAGGRVSVRDLGSTNGTYLNGVRADARELRDGDKLSVGSATLLVFTHDDGIERDYQRRRFRAAVQDGATAALRREVFLERLVEEVSFARRHGASLSVLTWELDGFAALSERLGAGATARCLAAVSRAASDVLEPEDLLGVLGPGKLVVACRETELHAASERGVRLRGAIAALAFEGTALTVSVGVAVSGPSAESATDANVSPSAEALLVASDAALVRARARGGDRVEVAPSVAPWAG